MDHRGSIPPIRRRGWTGAARGGWSTAPCAGMVASAPRCSHRPCCGAGSPPAPTAVSAFGSWPPTTRTGPASTSTPIPSSRRWRCCRMSRWSASRGRCCGRRASCGRSAGRPTAPGASGIATRRSWRGCGLGGPASLCRRRCRRARCWAGATSGSGRGWGCPRRAMPRWTGCGRLRWPSRPATRSGRTSRRASASAGSSSCTSRAPGRACGAS